MNGAPTYPYKVTPRWIRDVLRGSDGLRITRGTELPLDAGRFSAVLPLLRHHSVDAHDAPGLGEDNTLFLESAFAEASSKHFVAHAQKLAGDASLNIRRHGVYLRTDNRLTGQFIPPEAAVVGSVLCVALKSIDTALVRHRGYPGKMVICALLGAQILLTIHPFRDGNGRTARMFFAAKVLQLLGPAPTALLGMLLMQRSGAHQYHQACWALRAGDAEPMVRLFVESEQVATEYLFQGVAANLPPPELLRHCWMELRRLS